MGTICGDHLSLSKDWLTSLNKKMMRFQGLNETTSEIQGHCDERGTEDYNLSLGERRALAVVDELSRMNVGAGRLRTLSQGEKVPMLLGLDEQSFAENRRGEFVLLMPAQ